MTSNCFYTPASQGSLASITYSYDARLDKGSHQVAYRLLLFQNNTYYIGPLDTLTLDTWKSFGATLTVADFKAVKGEGPDRPDFSCTGPKIQFGYETSNSAGGFAGCRRSRALSVQGDGVSPSALLARTRRTPSPLVHVAGRRAV